MIHKRSKEKQAILQFLRTTNSHPTADAVYSEMRREIPNISLGKVYRNLRLLKEEGEISELELASNLSRFDGNTRPHYHFRCDKCNRVFDLNEEYDNSLNDRLTLKTGFVVSSHVMEFRGLCLDCRQNLPSNDQPNGIFSGQSAI